MVDQETGEIFPDKFPTNGTCVFLRTAYNYDVDAASRRSGLFCADETRAQQQFKDECDINVIVDRFGITGELPQGVRMPMNAEFDEVMDYQTALNRIIEADEAFMRFPAKIRERFKNDPQALIEFANNPANLEEARSLGLALAAPGKPEPMKVEIVAGTPQAQGAT